MTVLATPVSSANYRDANSPFFMDWTITQMRSRWEIVRAVTNGTEYLHKNADTYLPREPREIAKDGYDPWEKRVNLSVLTPFVKRLIQNAAGMVLRRRIKLEGGDPWWEEFFRKNVDGDGTSLDQFALKRLEVALTYGMSSILVDAPRQVAASAAEERSNLRPYFVPIDPWQYLGYRRDSDNPGAKLTQFRYQEQRKSDYGLYGEKYSLVARVIKPGRHLIFRAGEQAAFVDEPFSLGYIPLVNMYTEKEGFLCATPPMQDLAHLNIAHFRRLADLMHSLHVAAIGLLILEGYEENTAWSGPNYAIRMDPGNKAYWVQYDAGSLTAQAELLDRLENQISHLGVTKLLGQKFVAESADAKTIDHRQANCVLGVAATELEAGLNSSFQMASEYAGREPPKVIIDKDYDFWRLLGQDVSVLGDLEEKGQITTELFLQTLQRGEWISGDVNTKTLVQAINILKEKREIAMQKKAESLGPAQVA
jgi:hypothetical protein